MCDLSLNTVVFDLGGVLLDWNPRYLYRSIFKDDEERMEWFLATVCTQEWNATHDAGRSFSDGVAQLVNSHPELAAEIEAYQSRWPEMLGGAFDETVALLDVLSDAGIRLFALSNWSAETFPYAAAYPFMSRFDGTVVSGYEGVKKPDPELFQILIERHQLNPERALFVDDVKENLDTAAALGFKVHHFQSADLLAGDLAERGLPVEAPSV
jgi:2-haloacid dehalogenase